MSKLTRSLAMEVRSIDESDGTATFMITSAAVDSYNESVDPRGCNLTQFNRNSPLLDSHQYGTVRSVLGTVTRVYRKPEVNGLLADCKFAIDVPENEDARFAFGMIKSGYLKACSIGFVPESMVTPRDEDYDNVREELGLQDHEKPDRIYTSWTLKELSVCAIGANPEALVAMERSGALSARDVAALRKKIGNGRPLITEAGRGRENEMRTNFLERFGEATGSAARRFDDLDRETKRGFDDLEIARRAGNAGEIERAVRSAFAQMEREKRMAYGNPIAKYLDANPEHYEFLDVAFRWIGGAKVDTGRLKPWIERGWLSEEMFRRVFLPSDAMAPFPQPVSENVLNLTLYFGAFRDFFVPMPTEKTRFAKLTGVPNAYWINNTVTTLNNRQITADTALAGANIDETANTLGTIIEASREVLNDGELVIVPTLLEALTQGLGKGIDYAIFQGNGADDQTNGLITGIFADGNIPATAAGLGETEVKLMTRASFCNAVGAISAGALQRPENCRWWIHPSFIGILLQIKDGQSGQYLLRTPSQTGGEFELVGYPVTWAAQAPSTNGANKKIGAFGNRGAYLAAIREDVEVMSADGQKLNQNIRQIRGLIRGVCQTRDANSLTVLSTAAA